VTGIGLARQFSDNGYDLLIGAESELTCVQRRMRSAPGAQVWRTWRHHVIR